MIVEAVTAVTKDAARRHEHLMLLIQSYTDWGKYIRLQRMSDVRECNVVSKYLGSFHEASSAEASAKRHPNQLFQSALRDSEI